MKTQVEIVGEDVRFIRTFQAPRQVVFQAWTDPDKVRLWWGCAETTSVKSNVDLRVGGEYRHVMQISGAGEAVLVGTFTEIDPPKRLAYRLRTEPMEGIETPPPVTTQVDFKDLADRTEVCVTVTGLASSDLKDIISDGWKAAYEKLANLLKGTSQPVG